MRLQDRPIDNILVRSVNWIGDAVMTTPALSMVRQAFPRARITLAANPTTAELFRHHPHCDGVLVFDKKGGHRGPAGLWRFCRQLRKERFDLALLLQNAFEAALLCRWAGIPLRGGYATDGRRLLLTHPVAVGPRERSLHHTDYYRAMLRGLGIDGDGGGLRLHCTPEESMEAARILGEALSTELRDRRWVGLNAGAAYGSAKRWRPERFAAVGDRLAELRGMKVLVLGGPGEEETAREIQEAMTRPALNVAGKTSVREMMALVSRCRLLVTNDSGPMHVAAAFGVPVAAVFGPTDPEATSPRSPSFRVVSAQCECAPCFVRQCPRDHRCMESVSADDVLRAALELLEEAS